MPSRRGISPTGLIFTGTCCTIRLLCDQPTSFWPDITAMGLLTPVTQSA